MIGMDLIIVLIIVAIWEVVWKGIAMWKAGRNNQLAWYIWVLIVNSAGVLPIIYLAFYQKESKEAKLLKKLEKK